VSECVCDAIAVQLVSEFVTTKERPKAVHWLRRN
jgi:hypothetical protein